MIRHTTQREHKTHNVQFQGQFPAAKSQCWEGLAAQTRGPKKGTFSGQKSIPFVRDQGCLALALSGATTSRQGSHESSIALCSAFSASQPSDMVCFGLGYRLLSCAPQVDGACKGYRLRVYGVYDRCPILKLVVPLPKLLSK